MTALLPLLLLHFPADAPKVQTRFEQVSPVPADGEPTRSKDRTRAVVLIHGFILHLREATVAVPQFRDWQRPGCTLVKALEKDSDVYSFGYGQNASLDEIVGSGGLLRAVASLKKLGYTDIVLIGHSAGGLIARQFVEDHPDSGVTKVIQACAPNCGTKTAQTIVHAAQQPFVASLTPEGREKTLAARKDKRIPPGVEFVCLMAHSDAMHENDGVVLCVSQWSPELRKQCVPVATIDVGHNQAPRSSKSAEVLAKLVREKQPRWDAARVEKTCKELFGNK